MFFAFIPLLLAVGGIVSLLEMPGGLVSANRSVWEVALMFAVLPLWGGILGNLPLRWFGGVKSGSAGASLRRRIVHMAGWYAILAVTALPQTIALRTGMMAGMLEGVMAGFLVNFWLSDALSQHAFPARFSRGGGNQERVGSASPAHLEPQPAEKGGMGQTLRLSLPMLVLVLGGFGWSALMQLGGFSGIAAWSGGWIPQAAVSVATMAAMAMVAVPLLVRYCWGLKPLRGPETNALIREELDANGVSVAKICSWPDGMTGFATAGVIGLIPPFRYLLVSPALVAMLTPTELRSVIAHEAGHIKHRHLWYFLMAIIGFILLMQAAILLLDWSSLRAGFQMPGWMHLAGYFGALLLFLRFGIGLVSRIFERQADGNALRRLGPDAFSQALTKLAAYNGIPMEDNNWHHFGIAQRIRHARGAGAGGAGSGRLDSHDRRAGRLKAGLMALLAMGVMAEVALSNGAVTAYLDRMALENGEAPTRAQLPYLNRLAYRAVSREEHGEAQRYFRIILSLAPDNPTARNNLAWMLVTRPGASEPEMREALRLAKTTADRWEHAYIWDTLAETYFRLKRYDLALRTARKALLFAETGKRGGGASLGYYQEQVRKFSRFGGNQIEPGGGQ